MAEHWFGLPTRLADGLELESALILAAKNRGVNLRPVENWFVTQVVANCFPFGSPVAASGDATLGCIGCIILTRVIRRAGANIGSVAND